MPFQAAGMGLTICGQSCRDKTFLSFPDKTAEKDILTIFVARKKKILWSKADVIMLITTREEAGYLTPLAFIIFIRKGRSADWKD